MQLKKIIYTRPDGLVSIVGPAPKHKIELVLGMELTDQEYTNHIWASSVPEDAINPQYVEDESVLEDRTFRDAWKADAITTIKVDMPLAREIHMNKIRISRNKELERLDIETMKGNDVQAEKQALRDIPQTFDLSVAENPQQLKSLWPTELPQR